MGGAYWQRTDPIQSKGGGGFNGAALWPLPPKYPGAKWHSDATHPGTTQVHDYVRAQIPKTDWLLHSGSKRSWIKTVWQQTSHWIQKIFITSWWLVAVLVTILSLSTWADWRQTKLKAQKYAMYVLASLIYAFWKNVAKSKSNSRLILESKR